MYCGAFIKVYKLTCVVLVIAVFLIFQSCLSSDSSTDTSSSGGKTLPEVISFEQIKLEEPEDPLLNILWQYDPDSYCLVYLEEQIPYKINAYGYEIDTTEGYARAEDGTMQQIDTSKSKFDGWIIADALTGKLADMNTGIHETSHGFTSYYTYNVLQERNMDPLDVFNYNIYFIDRNKAIAVLPEDLPSVTIITETVDPLLKTGRYEYIKNEYSHNGVFGLLNEYCAYYQGARYSVKLFEYFKNEMEQDFETWQAYHDFAFWAFNPYYEFRYYILTYMMVLKETDPVQYSTLMGNHAFRLAFTELDNRFTETAEIMERILRYDFPEALAEFGCKNTITEKTLAPLKAWEDLSVPIPELTGYTHSVNYKRQDGVNAFISWQIIEPDIALLKLKLNEPEYLAMASELRLE